MDRAAGAAESEVRLEHLPMELQDDFADVAVAEIVGEGRDLVSAHLDMIDTFAFSTQVLSQGVRERRLLTLEDAVHRMTDLPARTFGLHGRGRIAAGYFADIVVFDPDSIACGPLHTRHDLPAGFGRLFCDAIGVEHVVVNGVAVVTHGEHTEYLPGKVLRSGSDTLTVPLAA